MIWMVSLGVRWQAFHWPHLIGFGVLILGMCAYNNVLPRWRRRRGPVIAADTAESPVIDDAEEHREP